MNLIELLIPVDGCWVRKRDEPKLGQVKGHRKVGGKVEIDVLWADKREWLPLEVLRSGFQNDWVVQDIPVSATRKPLGQGRVVGKRELGSKEQVLVQLDEDGQSVWLPYENLRRLKDVRTRYVRGETNGEDHPERFRLKLLAHALENWNHLTGSLDRLDVDPLPHQIQLVHRILSSGNYNWLIADDVGLGKTIEVGLLLAAMKRKGQGRRVLIVSPSGLTRQWQDELKFKFDLDYQIYARDFNINRPEHWKLHDCVIASIDVLKRDNHIEILQRAEAWDVVVFDEGHKLTRYASGERVQRYKLAEKLRPRSDAFLLLSATPHQGYADRFMALLELVRPDLRAQIQTLEANPEIVGEMILRNRKSEVTDAEGEFIFKGQQVHRVPVAPSQATLDFNQLLRNYFIRGYGAGAAAGSLGRAIGFVMTTYRKLASSSIASIEHALKLRRDRLVGQTCFSGNNDGEGSLDDLSEGGDDQDNLAETVHGKAEEFFSLELNLIDRLLASAKIVRVQDEKLRVFLDQVVDSAVNKEMNLLIFTEYRATQSYLKSAIEQRYGGEVLLINGSMSLDEKIKNIEAFNAGSDRFLISTEAGGEGLNLHKSCHVMVNYDLPWNPARLIQRIGRLYRYGQHETVVVFNLHAQDTFDNAAINLMLTRVDKIVQDMAPVGPEYNSRLASDIIGDILDNLDFASILQAATSMEIERTSKEIDDAIARARRAKELQDELFTHVAGYDLNALGGTLGFTMEHVNLFVRSMLPYIGASVEEESYGGRVLQIRLPEGKRGVFVEFANRTVVRVTTDRQLTAQLKEVVLLDFETDFFRQLIQEAKSPKFDGVYSSLCSAAHPQGVLAAFKLRWQNDQGQPIVEELLSAFAHADGNIEANPTFLNSWLVSSFQATAPSPLSPADRANLFDGLAAFANRRLGEESNRFKHPNSLVHLAAADFHARA